MQNIKKMKKQHIITHYANYHIDNQMNSGEFVHALVDFLYGEYTQIINLDCFYKSISPKFIEVFNKFSATIDEELKDLTDEELINYYEDYDLYESKNDLTDEELINYYGDCDLYESKNDFIPSLILISLHLEIRNALNRRTILVYKPSLTNLLYD